MPKIVSKRFAKGSTDGAGEGEAGEGGGAERELSGRGSGYDGGDLSARRKKDVF